MKPLETSISKVRKAPADDQHSESLEKVALLVSVGSTTLVPLLYFNTSNQLETVVPVLMAMVGWTSWLLFLLGYRRYTAHALVFGAIAVAVVGTLAFGSVRTSTNVFFVASVAGAGIFLGLRTLMAAVASSLIAVGGLIAAEANGLLSSADFQVGVKEWGTQAITIVVVAVMVFYSRGQIEKTSEKLRRSEERFAKAFNFSPLTMTITRLSDGTLLEVNEASDRVQGLKASEHKGRNSVDIGIWLTPDDRSTFVSKLRSEGRIHNYDTRLRHRDGRVVDTRLWAEMIEIDGEPCILTCSVDVSEDKRRDALLLDVARGVACKTGEDFFPALTRHMALALGADMVIVGELRTEKNIQTLSVWREGAHSQDFEFATQDAPCGQSLTETGICVHTEQLAARFPQNKPLVDAGFQAYLGQSMRDEQGTAIGVLSAVWKRPIKLTSEMQALMSIFSSRANAELLRLKRDREIQRFNETLELRVRERTADLQRLNSELDSFAYSVSHDLKSPLRSIDGFAHILSERLTGRLKEEEQILFDRMLASTHRMSNLIADMLALARVSQGYLELETVDLSGMVRDILEEEMAEQPERKVELRITPGLIARCDARLTRIALENLLGNALKYTRDQASPLIEFGLLPTASGLPPNFFVRDNGVGFDVSHADKLFKPFQRLHMPSEFEGTGIGLATVRRIIERHGGSITGYGEPGAGATFTFHLQAALP